MVITSALHAEGREFDPRRNLYSLFFFQKTHFNWNLWSQRDWCYFFVRFLIRWQASQTTTFEMHENAQLVCWMMLQLIGTRRTTQCGQMSTCAIISMPTKASAHSSRLAQSVEHETLNLGVVGSSPTLGVFFFFLSLPLSTLFYVLVWGRGEGSWMENVNLLRITMKKSNK